MVLVTCDRKCKESGRCSAKHVIKKELISNRYDLITFDGKVVLCFRGNKKPKYCIGKEMEFRYKRGSFSCKGCFKHVGGIKMVLVACDRKCKESDKCSAKYVVYTNFDSIRERLLEFNKREIKRFKITKPKYCIGKEMEFRYKIGG